MAGQATFVTERMVTRDVSRMSAGKRLEVRVAFETHRGARFPKSPTGGRGCGVHRSLDRTLIGIEGGRPPLKPRLCVDDPAPSSSAVARSRRTFRRSIPRI